MPAGTAPALAIVALLVLGAVACGSDQPEATTEATSGAPQASPTDDGQDGETLTVTGDLTYLQRIALEPDSTATVVLEDISRADASATVVAEQVIDLGDEQVPIPFELVADRSELDDRFTYSVRGTITGADGDLRWTTDTVNLVDPTEDAVHLGELVMVQVD